MGDRKIGDALAFTWHPGTPAGRQKAETETILKPAGQVICTRHCSGSIYERDCFKRVDGENRCLKVVL